MQFSLFYCEEFGKHIKKDLNPKSQSTLLTDLCLDPKSRSQYLGNLANAKTQPIQVLLKRMEKMKQSLPSRHRNYINRVFKYIQEGQLTTR